VDWAEAIEGFVDAEAKSFGEVVVVQGRAIDAVVGSSTLNAQLDSGGYLASEQVELGFISPVKYGGEPTRVNDLIELRERVWRVQEVRHNEGGLGLSVICELLPGVEPEGILYTIPATPGDVDVLEKIRQVVYYQPDKPSDITSGIAPAKPTEVQLVSTPGKPGEVESISAPPAPGEVSSRFGVYRPTEVEAITTPLAPGEVISDLQPLAPSNPGASIEYVDLFLVAGQSNAHGHSTIADLTSAQQTDINDFYFHTSWHAPSTSDATDQQYYSPVDDIMEIEKTRGQGTSSTLNSTQFGIDWGFAKKIKADYTTSNKVGVVKYAVGSSTIDDNATFADWDTTKDDECWGGLKNAIDDAEVKIKAQGLTPNWKGFLWYQGESNGGNDPVTYRGHLETLITAIENKLNATNLPSVFCAPADQSGNDMSVNDAFNQLAREQTFYDWIRISDHHDGTYSNVHLSASNMYDAGFDAGGAMIRAVTNTAPTSTEFDPGDLTTRLWLDMDDQASHGITNTAFNNPVTIINDKSGNGYSYTPSSGSSIRALKNIQNGKNIMRFNGNVDATNVTNIPFDSTARHKWFMVVRVIQFDAQDTLFLAQGNGLQLILFNRTGGSGVFKGEWYVHGGTHLAGTSTNILDQWVMLAVEWDIPNLRASTWLNGTAYNTNISNSVINKITTLQTRLNKYTNVADSDWGELIFAENITQDQSDKIEGYLTRKWGLLSDLPTTHPYKYITP
jgi:hypothetical protein